MQEKVGLNGDIFKIYKFRTMAVSESGKRIKQATLNDARITPLDISCENIALMNYLNYLMF